LEFRGFKDTNNDPIPLNPLKPQKDYWFKKASFSSPCGALHQHLRHKFYVFVMVYTVASNLLSFGF